MYLVWKSKGMQQCVKTKERYMQLDLQRNSIMMAELQWLSQFRDLVWHQRINMFEH